MSDRKTRKPYAAPAFPRFDGGTIVTTRCLAAFYIKERAGVVSSTLGVEPLRDASLKVRRDAIVAAFAAVQRAAEELGVGVTFRGSRAG